MCEVGLAAILCNIHPSAIVGSGHTRVGNAQNVWLANTPEPGLENNFTSSNNQDAFFLGLALEKTFTTNLQNLQSAFGIEVDYLKSGTFTGIVHPMVNVAPDFDTLNYSYKMNSYLFFANAKLSKLNLFSNLGAYIQGGIGGAVNKLYDYTETSPAGSSAAPMLAPFGDRDTSSFAYFIGAGVVWDMPNCLQFLIGYRYINSGHASFKRTPVQQTNNTLGFSFSNHFLVLSLLV